MNLTRLREIADRVAAISLCFLLAGIPLLVSPGAVDAWYRPKAHALYALVSLCLGGWGVSRALPGARRLRRPFPLLVPLALFASSAILSTVFSVDPEVSLTGDTFRHESLPTLLAYSVLPLVFFHCLDSLEQVRRLLILLLLASLAIALQSLLDYGGVYVLPSLREVTTRLGPGAGSVLGNPNFMGKYFVLILPLVLATATVARSARGRAGLGASAVLCVAALAVSFTRASWLGAAVAVGILGVGMRVVAPQPWGRRLGVVLLCCALVLAGSLGVAWTQKRDTFAALAERIESAFDFEQGTGSATRLFVWGRCLQRVLERPLVGFGPDAHQTAMAPFNLEYCLKFNDWTVEQRDGRRVYTFYNWTVIDRAHNNYIDIALAQGFLGLGAYLAVIATFLVWLGRAVRRERDPEKKICFLAVLAAFAGVLVNDLFIFSIVSVSTLFWSLMGLTMALPHLWGGRSPGQQIP